MTTFNTLVLDYWEGQLEAVETLEGAPNESENEPASHWNLTYCSTFCHLDDWVWTHGHFIYGGSQIVQVRARSDSLTKSCDIIHMIVFTP